MKKLLYIQHNQCTTRYRMHPNGCEFIALVDSDSEAYREVSIREDLDWFPQDDGTVNRANQSGQCFDPKYPDRFDFGDFCYYVKNVEELDDFFEPHLINMVEEN